MTAPEARPLSGDKEFPGDKPLGEPTRERLLYAAGEVFADQGFRKATVRAICGRAGVNVASVNYHFSSKQDLYAAVLEFAFRQSLRRYPPGLDEAPGAAPERRLFLFIRNFLFRLLHEESPAWFGRLMAREIVEPTGALDRIVDTAIRPLHEALGAVVREILGNRAGDEDVRRCVFSILGQCLFYRHAMPVVARLYPPFRWEDEEIERTARHVAAFSLAALRHMAHPKRGGR